MPGFNAKHIYVTMNTRHVKIVLSDDPVHLPTIPLHFGEWSEEDGLRVKYVAMPHHISISSDAFKDRWCTVWLKPTEQLSRIPLYDSEIRDLIAFLALHGKPVSKHAVIIRDNALLFLEDGRLVVTIVLEE